VGGVQARELLRVNSIDDPRSLRGGQQLRIPRSAPGSPTAVQPRTSATAVHSTATAGANPAPPTTPSPARTSVVTATPVATATPTAGTGGRTYTVQAGDIACIIAQKLGVPLQVLTEANRTTIAGLVNLSIGQVFQAPSTHGPAGCRRVAGALEGGYG
jgi:LysM repeat protein